jgi:hypothetical protein
VSVIVIKLHTIEAYSVSEITQVNYSFRSLSRKENENVLGRIKAKNVMASENMRATFR